MERDFWTDERLNESFDRLMREIAEGRTEAAEFRAEMRTEFRGVNARLDALEKRADDHSTQLGQLRGDISSLYRGLLAAAIVIIAVLLAAQLAG